MLLQEALDVAERTSQTGIGLATALQDVRAVMFGHLNLVGIALRRGSTATAARSLLDALTMPANGYSMAETPPPPGAMEMLPCVAAEAGDAFACARFRGAIDANWQRIALQRAHAEDRFYESFISTARSQLSVTAFDECCHAGRALPLKSAAAEGRAWLERYLA